jgi:proteasome lid subunit RPN8/RPN11
LSTPFQPIVPRSIYDDMIAQARSELPNECCGILAGQVQESGVRSQESEARSQRSEARNQESDTHASLPVITVVQRYALVNAAASPTEYLSDARSMFEAVRDMRGLGLEILAIYHFIISLQDGNTQMRGWWLSDKDFREADWRLAD